MSVEDRQDSLGSSRPSAGWGSWPSLGRTGEGIFGGCSSTWWSVTISQTGHVQLLGAGSKKRGNSLLVRLGRAFDELGGFKVTGTEG
jgi:hypothetical protein